MNATFYFPLIVARIHNNVIWPHLRYTYNNMNQKIII